MNPKLIIFLAFANDKEDNARYLRNLTKELHEIEIALKPVKEFYEVIHYQGITLEILFDKFQEYKDRIAIFHFGGHADGYQLLLQSDKGGNQIAYGKSLIDFFSTFKESLKVVFFNGCITENLTKDLAKIGIPITIGTESTINDDVATQLAIRFYNGLANDHTIENAWKQAVGAIGAAYDLAAGTRGLFRKGEVEHTEKFAWEMVCNDEAKILKLRDLIPKLNIDSINKQIAKASSELESVTSIFHNLPESHIKRKETNDLLEWVKSPLPLKPNKPTEKPEPIALLVGEAGMGKSVIMKDLFLELKKENIPCLALKADRLAFENITLLKQELGLEDDIDKLLSNLADSYEKVVLLIDQIDALSQTLSSKRKPIELYLRIISNVSNISNIRVIVSCRNYDLKYDPDLEKYKGKQIFQVENLSKENVLDVFRQLNLDNKLLTDKLFSLLCKPLNLDVFCRVCIQIQDFTAIDTLQNLYDILWDKIVCHKAKTVDDKIMSYDKLHQLIKNLADEMYEKQNIFLQKRPYINSGELKYLITEGLIQESENRIQFFHQTFFDYVFAKSFVESGKSLSKDLLQRPQNLFIRSQVKQVLNYLRDYDLDNYLNEVKTLLLGERYRFHIKLLVINQLGFQKEITRKEEQLVQNLVLSNSLFSNAFLESIENAQWLDLLQKTKLIDEIPNRDNEQELNATYKMFRRLLAKQPDIVLPILRDLARKNIYQPYFLTGVLLNITDFSQPLFPEVFNLLKPYLLQENRHSTYFYLLDESIKQIPEWAFEEFLNTFKEILELTKDSATKILNDQEFDFVKKLFQQNAHLGFDLALQIIHLLLAKTKYEYYADYVPKSSLRDNSAFDSYIPKSNDHDNNKQLLNLVLEYLEGLVSSDFKKIRLYIHDFLASQSLTLHILACELMRNNVSLFVDEVYNNLITKENYLYESNYGSDYFCWQIRDLIGQVFPILDDTQRQNIVDLYFEDYKPNRNYIGWHKRRIMNAIPEIFRKQHKELNKEFLELERRFGKLEDEKPRSRGVFRGYHGLKPKAYPKMSLDMWKKSFLKHNGKHLDLRNHKVDISGHSEVFKQEVKKNPAKFLKLIEEIIQDENINIQYRIRGLEGLKEGNHNPEEVKRLFKIFLTHLKDRDYITQSIWFVDYFIQNQNVDKEIIEFLGNNALRSQDSGRWENDGGSLMVGINSIKGAAVHKLIQCYFHTDSTDYIFDIVEKLAQEPTLPVRASIMYHLALLNKLNKERSLNIFLTITRDFEPEILKVCSWSLQRIVYIDFEKMILFFEKVITIKSKEIEQITAINLMRA